MKEKVCHAKYLVDLVVVFRADQDGFTSSSNEEANQRGKKGAEEVQLEAPCAKQTKEDIQECVCVKSGRVLAT